MEVAIKVARAAEKYSSITDLYEHWWSGRGVASPLASPLSVTDSRHAPTRWRCLVQHEDGSVIVERGGMIGRAVAGEWLFDDGTDVLVARRRTWSTDGFVWASSAMPAPPVALSSTLRIYIPGGDDPSRDFTALTRALERLGTWYKLKSRSYDRGRRDQLVIWIPARDILDVLSCIRATLEPGNRLSPPPITLVKSWIGLAHEPYSAESYGMIVCGAVVSMADRDPSDPVQSWAVAASFYGLNHEQPWRHPNDRLEELWISLENS